MLNHAGRNTVPPDRAELAFTTPTLIALAPRARC